MINATQLRLNIIRPTLEYLAPEIPYSLAAENLLMGTCAQESKLGTYLVQLGDGPARGIYQMETATEIDINQNFLSYRIALEKLINNLLTEFDQGFDDLTGNLFYATAMARVHYFRQPTAMPDKADIHALAAYWKKYYNTPLGKGTEQEFIDHYIDLVLP